MLPEMRPIVAALLTVLATGPHVASAPGLVVSQSGKAARLRGARTARGSNSRS